MSVIKIFNEQFIVKQIDGPGVKDTFNEGTKKIFSCQWNVTLNFE